MPWSPSSGGRRSANLENLERNSLAGEEGCYGAVDLHKDSRNFLFYYKNTVTNTPDRGLFHWKHCEIQFGRGDRILPPEEEFPMVTSRPYRNFKFVQQLIKLTMLSKVKMASRSWA